MNLIAPLVGGLLIGLSALAMLALLGRITGISGIFAGVLNAEAGLWRWAFLSGLILAPLLYHGLSAQPAPMPSSAGWLLTSVAGVLVGFGTRHAGGCTSGHTIMGLSNLQWPSLVATCCFMAGGFLMVHLIFPWLMSL